ncbi:class I SAM-dependent methyltransferase [Pseudomonas anguilliseptica]|uniref:class I SAM-dependent methyltransferase n=1 Tax=Pseudomonas anguilliseptica TaxID=53406 RepID=UPI00373618D4
MRGNHVSRLFGARADAYASFRPHYPESLFAWLAAQCPERLRALDIACGNGQASYPLLQHFKQVLACDASLEQLQAGADQTGLHLFVAEAQTQPLPSHSLDLIVVAQALHWFATPAFFSEVRRLLKPGGVFCAWCYSLMRIDNKLDALIDDLYWNTLGGYWPVGRASVDAGYSDINNPFSTLAPPASAIEANWTLEQLLGYLRTWSAVQRYEQQNGADPLLQLQPALRQAWGDAKQPRFVRWPLHFLAGTPN